MKYLQLIIGLVLSQAIFANEPWGKDADLCCQKKITQSLQKECSTPILGSVGECLIRFHQEVISPADGPRSHYIPSSSQYTLDSMRCYGFFKGFTMGCDRLMRENDEPWKYRKITNSAGDVMKFDPVP